MGGEITVDSTPGKGSEFAFVAEFALPADLPELPPARPGELTGQTALVVQAGEKAGEVSAEILRLWAIEPMQARSTGEAAAALSDACQTGRAPALMLIDATLGESDGVELADRLRRLVPSAAVVMLLGPAGGHDETSRCRRAGLEAMVTKPFVPRMLAQAVTQAMQRRASSGDARTCESPDRPGRTESDRSCSSLRILLAEDNRINQMLAEALLTKAGHEVVIVDNGRSAVEAVRADRFDAVLMDLQMPEMGGMEATATIRRDEAGTGRHTPIIAMTAHAMAEDRGRCLDGGMDGYVSKPVDQARLREALAQATAGAAGIEATAPSDASPDVGGH
jgi:CheY-like chemotaxis protein